MEAGTVWDVVLIVRCMTVTFERRIIRNLTFEILKGNTLATIRPNGSGKSVLLNRLLGLIPYEGSVLWLAGTRLAYVPRRSLLTPSTAP